MKNQLIDTLYRVYREPLHLQADYARQYDQEIATLASIGLISNSEGHMDYGRKWRVTGIGMDSLKQGGLL